MYITRKHITHLFCFLLGCSFSFLLTNIQLKEDHQQIHFEKEDYHIIIIILSATTNVLRRNSIRETWVKDLDHRSQYMFVVGGLGVTIDQRRQILLEQKHFGDILLLPLYDNYSNLTKKLLASFNHIYETYKFDYLLKVDDDSFVNIKSFPVAVDSLNSDNSKPLYWGYFSGRATVFKKGKWKEDKWFLCDRYLPYALGGGYVLSFPAVQFIALNSHLLSVYTSEDISVGVWLSPLNLTRHHDVRFDTGHISRGCLSSHLVKHKVSMDSMRSLYSSLINFGTICSQETELIKPYTYNWTVLPSKCCNKVMR